MIKKVEGWMPGQAVTMGFFRKAVLLICPFIILSTIFHVIVPGAEAGTFYISNAGDDLSDGMSEKTPWQTTDKLNSLSPEVAGGSSFLFRRGDTFRGEIELKGDPENVTFGAYGAGDNPVISGSVEITGWSHYRGSIYAADARALTDSKIHHLFVNGELMTIARFPDAEESGGGWLQTGISYSKNSFSDPALVERSGNKKGYWDGANIRIRTFSWLFETRTVAGVSSDGVLTMDSDLTETLAYNIQPGWGYYLDNKLSELDHEGEWFFDEAERRVYLFPPGGADPNGLRVEGSVYETGIRLFWHDHGSTVENLTFRHQTCDGISINQCDGVVIRNNIFEYCERTGVNMAWNSVDIGIENNRFSHMLDCAIAWNANISAGDSSTIKNNIIKDTAVIPGYGGSGAARSVAVRIYGAEGIKIVNNIIENTGYAALALEGDGQLVLNNTIRGTLLTLDDGGGILVNSNNNRINGNLISGSLGNRDISSGTHNGKYFRQMGMGIFFLPKMAGNIIENNTVEGNTDFGIYPDRAVNTLIRNNTVYNNRVQIYLHGCGGDAAGNDYGNKIMDNILFPAVCGQVCLSMDSEFNSGNLAGNFCYDPCSHAGFSSRLFSNATGTPLEMDLEGKNYRDTGGNSISGSMLIDPFSSVILIREILRAPDLMLGVSGTAVELSWSPVSGADGYYLIYAPFPDAGTVGYFDVKQMTSLSIDLPSGSSFYVAVQAYDGSGTGEYSNIESFQIE